MAREGLGWDDLLKMEQSSGGHTQNIHGSKLTIPKKRVTFSQLTHSRRIPRLPGDVSWFPPPLYRPQTISKQNPPPTFKRRCWKICLRRRNGVPRIRERQTSTNNGWRDGKGAWRIILLMVQKSGGRNPAKNFLRLVVYPIR